MTAPARDTRLGVLTSDSAAPTDRGPAFAITVAGKPVLESVASVAVRCEGAERTWSATVPPEVVQNSGGSLTVTGALDGCDLAAVWTARRLGRAVEKSVMESDTGETGVRTSGVWELSLTITNQGATACDVSLMDPLAAEVVPGDWNVLCFTSSWGEEFVPESRPLGDGIAIGSFSGRSSHGWHPWLGLHSSEAAVVISPAWSGNWHVDLKSPSGTAARQLLTAGISPWEFSTIVEPGASVTSPSVVLAVGSTLEVASKALSGAIGEEWIPRTVASDAMPVEWNHWWPYEDADVTERVISDNAAIAGPLGIEVVTVDAGWFGAPDAMSDWQEQRGDWDQVNTARFPGGLRALGDSIRATGARAGIWLEGEAIGAEAMVRRSHPRIVALGDTRTREPGEPTYRMNTVSVDPADPTFLGYVCLGSAEGRTFVAEALDRVIDETGAVWLKLDFNIDPGAGCTRTDHGHGAADGLFRHYEGLYGVLDEFRARHPEVILEACSSGGLRLDLGLAKHVHCLFLSDPDYTEHHLQVFWGASLMLPPAAMLHWSWSQWRGDHAPSQLDFSTLSADDFDTTLRAAMLQRFGVSLRLPELRADLRERLALHVDLFTNVIAPFVRNGVIERLTEQPLRNGEGERNPAFQLSADGRHLLLAICLPGGTTTTRIAGTFDPTRSYRATDLATGRALAVDGASVTVPDDPRGTITSWLILIEPSPDAAGNP